MTGIVEFDDFLTEEFERMWGCTVEEKIARDFEQAHKDWHRFMAAAKKGDTQGVSDGNPVTRD